ncbi:MAG: hypothetical protein JWO28_2184 [Hyphomicrobiales bacterium]|nr:hypothetical protein [Hyphomicrobiales bacterium]
MNSSLAFSMEGGDIQPSNSKPGIGYYRALDVNDAVRAKRDGGPHTVFLGGGTALQLGWDKDPDVSLLIDVLRFQSSAPCRLSHGVLEINAFTSLESLRCDRIVKTHFPALATALGSIASFGIRSLGTFGGNLAWQKGDLRPLLLAAGATMSISKGTVTIDDWLVQRDEDDLLVSVRIPMAARQLTFEKIGYREAFSPSSVTLAFSLDPADPKIAVGGGDNRTGRLHAVEYAFSSSYPSLPRQLASIVAQEAMLTDSITMSAADKAVVVANVLRGHAEASTIWRS